MKKWHWFALSLLLVFVDQLTKYWAGLYLIPYKPMPIVPCLNFTLAFNTGAAFSFLSGAGGWHRWFFASFSVLMSIVLMIWLYRTPAQSKLLCAAISFVLGGAVGNLIDRAFYGYVVDFIDVYYQHHHFATFNIADAAISIGAALFILELFMSQKDTK
ncbi:MAG: signal peptidase II [Legionella sp. 40-6]|nr:lipoprotein signal peptidase [Legionella sp.]OJY37831.1 MAG: signal peptidase II [Legionella sp. 40-6]